MFYFGNVMVLKIFGHYKVLRVPAKMLIINLAVCDDLGFIIGLFPEASTTSSIMEDGYSIIDYLGYYITHAFSGALCDYSIKYHFDLRITIKFLTFDFMHLFNIIISHCIGWFQCHF